MSIYRQVALLCLVCALMGCERVSSSRVNVPPRVVVTTTIAGDIVARIAGDEVDVEVLMQPEADAHNFIFRPVDLARIADADLLFINGAGMEANMERVWRAVKDPVRVISLAQNVPLRYFDTVEMVGHHHHGHDHPHHHGCSRRHPHPDGAPPEDGRIPDPHLWMDPTCVMRWTQTIADALSRLAPDHAALFAARANELTRALEELDAWLFETVKAIPAERRLLVSDHLSMGYFADRYGFQQAGVLLESFDSMAQASARELANLTDTLQRLPDPVLFVGIGVNPALAEQVARDTGAQVVRLPFASLTYEDGVAPDYFAYMRYIAKALRQYLAPEV